MDTALRSRPSSNQCRLIEERSLTEHPSDFQVARAGARGELEGLSSPPSELEGIVAQAEAAIEADEYGTAVTTLGGIRTTLRTSDLPRLELRALFAESWARMFVGEIVEAIPLLERARALTEKPGFSDIDRAEALYRLGCCRFKLSGISTSLALLTLALELCDHSDLPCDRLRAHVLEWRSRCYQRQRDWDAARADVDKALELAEALGDTHTMAHIYFQASVIAERTKEWLLARFYAESARELYAKVDDWANVGKVENNLGGLSFLVGEPDRAIEHLKESFRIALELGNEVEAAFSTSSLAQVQLRAGDVGAAEQQARQALKMLGTRVDLRGEVGNAQLVLGRALLEQDRLDEAAVVFYEAERNFTDFSSLSHCAAAWMAQAELAHRRGDTEAAASLYKRAAEALQDVHI